MSDGRLETEAETKTRVNSVGRETRVVQMVNTVRCVKSGRVTSTFGEPTPTTIVKHECGNWTEADGNFCQMCGKKLEALEVH